MSGNPQPEAIGHTIAQIEAAASAYWDLGVSAGVSIYMLAINQLSQPYEASKLNTNSLQMHNVNVGQSQEASHINWQEV